MSTDQQRTETVGVGLSRRQVLARGAVAAGVVWAAPVIRTATAYATSAAGTERPCTKFYLVCLDSLGPRPVRFLDSDQGYDEMPSDSVLARYRPIAEEPTTTTSSTTTSTSTTSTSSTSTTSTSSTSTTSTSTTTTTKPFKDPTAGIGLFEGESNTDPRQKTKPKDKKKRKKPAGATDETTTTTTTTTPTDPNAVAADPGPDGLGLFADPNAEAAAVAATAVPVADDLPPGIKQWLDDNPDVPLRYPDTPPVLSQTGEDAWAVMLPVVRGGPNPATHQCRAVKGWAQSGDHNAEYYIDPNVVGDEQGLRLIFPNPIPADAPDPKPIDRCFLVYCCP